MNGSLASRLALTLGATALALAAGELAARLLLPPVFTATIQARRVTTLPDEATSRVRATAQARISEVGLLYPTANGRRMAPNANVIIENHALSGFRVGIATNALGYRNPHLETKSVPRVLFLGDSITVADYLPEPQTFVRLVQRFATEDGIPLETVNAGVSGIGMRTEIAILRETGLATEPDAVVLCFYLNDFDDSVGRRLSPRPGWLPPSRLIDHVLRVLGLDKEAIVPRDDRRAREWAEQFRLTHAVSEGDPLTDRDAFGALVVEAMSDWGGAWSAGAWDELAPLFEELGELARAHGFVPLVVAFPVRAQVEAGFLEDWPQRQLAELAQWQAMPMLDLLPVLRAAWQREPDAALFYDHCHHTARGSHIIARAVAGFVTEQLQLEPER